MMRELHGRRKEEEKAVRLLGFDTRICREVKQRAHPRVLYVIVHVAQLFGNAPGICLGLDIWPVRHVHGNLQVCASIDGLFQPSSRHQFLQWRQELQWLNLRGALRDMTCTCR